MTFHPFILKEFNNRWFVVGKRKSKEPIMTLALDRINSIDFNLGIEYLEESFDGDEFYKNTIGVTVMPDKYLMEIHLRFDRLNAPYVLTKPLHSSQEVLEKLDDGGVIVKINVHHNYELERLLLGFGDSLEVLRPRNIRRRIKKKLEAASEMYSNN